MRSHLRPSSLVFLLALGLLAAPALRAESLASSASSASSAGSESSGSASDSLRGSSNSSKRDDDRRSADGRYRIEAVAVADKPGRVQLTLRSLEREGEVLTLELPQPAFDGARLARGDVVTATPRPYGIQFAAAATARAFFLVLDDAWMRELPSRPVTL